MHDLTRFDESRMQVKRIVAHIAIPDPALADSFYRDILGLELAMDHGWIREVDDLEVRDPAGRLLNILLHA